MYYTKSNSYVATTNLTETNQASTIEQVFTRNNLALLLSVMGNCVGGVL